MLGSDIGILIFNNNCNLLEPNEVADSTVSFETCLIPLLVNQIIGGIE